MKTKPKKKDKYDEAVEFLKAHPSQIVEAWNFPYGRDNGGCLFTYVKPHRSSKDCGCLTQVKMGDREAFTPELTEAIRNDKRIPPYIGEVKPKHLPVFAEWQRRIDRELNRA